jgi:hypothetical protein
MSACRCPERSRDPNGSTGITGLRFYLTRLRMFILQAHKVKAQTRGEGTLTPEHFLKVSLRVFFCVCKIIILRMICMYLYRNTLIAKKGG